MSAVAAPRTPQVVASRSGLRDLLADARRAGRTVALVPTMGALHEGHLSLVEAARERVGSDGVVVVSIFVNPLQFAAGEDLDAYPRTLEHDLAACGEVGVDIVWAPSVDDVYPDPGSEVTVDPGPIGGILEGAVRPTHFRGVLTVVATLFGVVRPDVAVFGEKDYQQLVLVTAMVRALGLGVDVVGVPTRREHDGLALSSRNRYLDAEGRGRATVLPQALRAGVGAAEEGYESVLATVADHLHTAGFDVDYVALRTPDLRQEAAHGPARLLAAVRVGATRLIDNVALDLPATPPGRHRPDPETQIQEASCSAP